MPDPVVPVILSGGAGTRLWPLSRQLMPKQFLPLAGPRTMLQDTALRASGEGFAAPLVVCNEEHRFIVAEQLRAAGVAPRSIILEPEGRHTAAAVAVAALWLARSAPDAVMLVQPSDHVIADVERFRIAVAAAARAARQGLLVTFGITPTAPETGYGWIELGAPADGLDGIHRVARFVEKPSADAAARLLAAGGHAWNSGMFVFTAAGILAELDRHAPAITAACRAAVAGARADLDFLRLDGAAFAAAPAVALDVAVMERTSRAVVVPAALGWSDVGAWGALRDIGARDAAGNVVVGDVIQLDSEACYLRSDGPLVAAIGLRDFVVVATQDAVLVAPRDESQKVRAIVDRLAAGGRREAAAHPQTYRPWGYWQTIDRGPGFQVKRIRLHAGGAVRPRRHRHAAQHWVVVAGTAQVTVDAVAGTLRAGQSISIPPGAAHALLALGDEALDLIEVQTGPDARQDDFERVDAG
ncbi:MAG: mannose-1-phosphate guanylyltransferase/mannose-6-phosphate isomerase [Alphaproteobacteria bacterium]